MAAPADRSAKRASPLAVNREIGGMGLAGVNTVIKKIIVGVDLSEESIVALDKALEIARGSGAHVVMVSAGVGERDSDLPWLRGETRAGLRALAETEQVRRTDALERLRQTYGESGVDLSHVVTVDPPERALVDVAADLDADLIALGAHGANKRQRFLIGSVAARIVRQAECDVLIARGTEDHDCGRILVATDFSDTSRRALDRAMELARPGSVVTLVHCWSVPPNIAGFSAGDLMARVEADATARIEKLASEVATNRIEVTTVVREGYPASIIREMASSADLVAIGSHGRRGFRRLILGSVAEKIIRHAPCSVLVARCPGQEAE